MTRVVLADQPHVRGALRLLLRHEVAIEVVGEAGDADELLARVRTTRPDVVLLAWDLRGVAQPSAALGALTRAAGASPPKVVVLCSRPEDVAAAVSAGADAVVSMTDPPEQLLAALAAVSGS